MENKVFKNHMQLEMDAVSENEALARIAVSGFLSSVDPTLEELDEIKTAVSEAITNSIIHGYEEKKGTILLRGRLTSEKKESTLHLEIEDYGKGIANVEEAREPLFTTKPEEDRAGMGFMFMEMFMDSLEIESVPGEGTKIRMLKKLKKNRVV